MHHTRVYCKMLTEVCVFAQSEIFEIRNTRKKYGIRQVSQKIKLFYGPVKITNVWRRVDNIFSILRRYAYILLTSFDPNTFQKHSKRKILWKIRHELITYYSRGALCSIKKYNFIIAGM